MKYKSVIVTQRGGPKVLQVAENDMRHLLEASRANALLEAGGVFGNLVLLAPELL